MTLFGWLILITASSFAGSQRLQISAPNGYEAARDLQRRGVDIVEGTVSDRGLQVVIPTGASLELETGWLVTSISEGAPLSTRGLGTGYLDYEQLVQALYLVADQHPEVAQVLDLTSSFGAPPTSEGRHIYALRLSDPAVGDAVKPQVLLVGAHHAREINTPVLAMEFIHAVLDGYSVDAEATALLVTRDVWVVPVFNPDGYQWVFDVDDNWRKNRRPVGDEFGVDQNRNYDFDWNGACGGSTDPASGTFRGSYPMSEPETIAMQRMATELRFFKVLDLHSFGEEVLWSSPCSPPPLGEFTKERATVFANALGYDGAIREASADGEHFEWARYNYGVDAFLIEVGEEFQPVYEVAVEQAKELMAPLMAFYLEEPTYRLRVVNACNGDSVVASVVVESSEWSLYSETSTMNGSVEFILPDESVTTHVSAEGFVSRLLKGLAKEVVELSPIELCNDLDDDCDGVIDNDCVELVSAPYLLHRGDCSCDHGARSIWSLLLPILCLWRRQ